MNTSTLAKLAPVIDTTVAWLVTGNDEPSNATVAGPLDYRTNDLKIPVYGMAVGGIDGEFPLNGNQVAEVLSPPTLLRTNGAYAVQIAGDSMEPRYRDGEIAYVDPSRRVVRGDYVVAQVHVVENEPPLAFIKRLVRHTSAELVLEQFNPAKELKFDGRRVKSVHQVVMAGAMTGVT